MAVDAVGSCLDPALLRKVIDDRATLQTQRVAATAQDRTWLPRVHDRLEQAVAVGERPLHIGAAGWRPLPQVADAHHWAGRFDRAAQLGTEALPLSDAVAWVATTRRRTGERRFGQGDDTRAPVEPETAFRVRPRAGTARILSVSSAMPVHRARELAGR